MCKTFSLSIKGEGTQAQIIKFMRDMIAATDNSPVRHSRIEARYIKQQITAMKREAGQAEAERAAMLTFKLPFDHCPKCEALTPTLRTFKANQCIYCGDDRQQDISIVFTIDNLTGSISEIDND